MKTIIWNYIGNPPIGINCHERYSVYVDRIDDVEYIMCREGRIYDLSGFIEINEFIKKEYDLSIGDYFYVNEDYIKENDTNFKRDTKYKIDYIRLDLEPYGRYSIEIFVFLDNGDGDYDEISYDDIITIDGYRNLVINEILE